MLLTSDLNYKAKCDKTVSLIVQVQFQELHSKPVLVSTSYSWGKNEVGMKVPFLFGLNGNIGTTNK